MLSNATSTAWIAPPQLLGFCASFWFAPSQSRWHYNGIKRKHMSSGWHTVAALVFASVAVAQTGESAADLAARYLPELIRLDTTNPPGNETRVAKYLKQVADGEGISAELLGDNPQRLNFVARLRGSGRSE